MMYRSSVAATTIAFSGIGLFGASLVLLAKSPFRTPPTERLFRIVWLGPIGRGFVWLSMRGVRPNISARHAPPRPPLVRGDGSASRSTATPAPRVEQLRPTLQTGALPSDKVGDPIAGLEARVTELEQWRRNLRE